MMNVPKHAAATEGAVVTGIWVGVGVVPSEGRVGAMARGSVVVTEPLPLPYLTKQQHRLLFPLLSASISKIMSNKSCPVHCHSW